MPSIKTKKAVIPKDDRTTIAFVEQLKRQWLETIDAIPDPLIVVDDSHIIMKANAAMAEIAGSSVKELVGQVCYKAFAGRSTPCDNCQMVQSKPGQSAPGYEIFNGKNERWYEVATRRLRSDSGQKGVVQIYRDRTDAKLLQNRLTQNEKLASIGQLAGGFAHEINNPLGGILVFAQMLLKEMDKESLHYQDVVEIEAAAKRCKTIVENLLQFSRQRPINHQLEEFDVHPIIANAVKFADLGHNKDRRCTIKLKLDAADHVIKSDANRLTQVFLNLCINALQAMPRGGTLCVETQNENQGKLNMLVVKVIDQGVGIKPEHLAKIFEPFFTTKEPGQGTGLGLSIVHGIIQDLGATIDVARNKSKGVTFTVKIPATATATKGRQP
jgi:two-component system NtrC family sensor kinase